MSLPTQPLLRPTSTLLKTTHAPFQPAQQIRHASLLRRPIRPYTFTQLISLSDGSTYLTRSTSPAPVFRSTKDTRNHPLWQPTLDSLRNVESDEAGRLRAFRGRYGRGWDFLEGEEGKKDGKDEKEAGAAKKEDVKAKDESLMDLIAGGGAMDAGRMKGVVNTRGGKQKK